MRIEGAVDVEEDVQNWSPAGSPVEMRGCGGRGRKDGFGTLEMAYWCRLCV
jgi:hypothetical protein